MKYVGKSKSGECSICHPGKVQGGCFTSLLSILFARELEQISASNQ